MVRPDDIKRFHQMYSSGYTPWDTGRPDKNLVEIFPSLGLKQGDRILEIGCGTGDNAIFFAKQGCIVTATEIVSMAMEKAELKARAQGLHIIFHLLDITREDIPGGPFSLAFDRGCFHHYRDQDARKIFASRVVRHLSSGGMWLSLAGNADEKRQGPGPPQLSAKDIVTAVESYFEILILKSSYFDSDMSPPPRCWLLLARKR